MKDWSSYTHAEVRTGIGQLLSVDCEYDPNKEKIEEIKKFFADRIRSINIPENNMLNIQHGGYGRYTRYKIEQHRYAGGGNGYFEVLEIKNPPDGRHPYVLYVYNIECIGSAFYEFKNLKAAIDSFDTGSWRRKQYSVLDFDPLNRSEEEEKWKPPYIRKVFCGPLAPWFYAQGDQPIHGDFVAPDECVFSDTLYKPGAKMVVTKYGDPPVIKTVWCVLAHDKEVCKETVDYKKIYEKVPSKIVVFDDGFSWVVDDLLVKARIAEASELWADAAINEFKRVLAGEKKSFKIKFTDGSCFSGRFAPKQSRKKIDPKNVTDGGKYYLECVIEGKDDKVCGWVEYGPGEKNLYEFVKKGFENRGVVLLKAVVTDPPKTKWEGAYEKPK